MSTIPRFIISHNKEDTTIRSIIEGYTLTLVPSLIIMGHQLLGLLVQEIV